MRERVCVCERERDSVCVSVYEESVSTCNHVSLLSLLSLYFYLSYIYLSICLSISLFWSNICWHLIDLIIRSILILLLIYFDLYYFISIFCYIYLPISVYCYILYICLLFVIYLPFYQPVYQHLLCIYQFIYLFMALSVCICLLC